MTFRDKLERLQIPAQPVAGKVPGWRKFACGCGHSWMTRSFNLYSDRAEKCIDCDKACKPFDLQIDTSLNPRQFRRQL